MNQLKLHERQVVGLALGGWGCLWTERDRVINGDAKEKQPRNRLAKHKHDGNAKTVASMNPVNTARERQVVALLQVPQQTAWLEVEAESESKT